jgi:hypothetical protein
MVGAVIYAYDHTPRNQCGLYSGAVWGLANGGIFVGSAVAAMFHHFMKPAVLKVRYTADAALLLLSFFLCGSPAVLNSSISGWVPL